MDSPLMEHQQATGRLGHNNRGQDKLTALFMQAPAAIAVLEGPSHTYTFSNPLYQKLFGRTEKELSGRTFREVFPEIKGQGIYELFDNTFRTGVVYTANEFPATFSEDGISKTGYYNFVVQPIKNDAGAVTDLMVIAYDVTAQVEAHKATTESEEKYRSLFQRMDQGFCIVEMIFDAENKAVDYRFLEANPVFEKQTGLRDAVGKTAKELVPGLEGHWFETYGNVALTGEPTRFAEGSEAMGRWFEVYAFRIGRAEMKKVAVLFTDITLRKKAEEAVSKALEATEKQKRFYEAITNNTPDLIYVFDPNYRFTYANKALLSMWGRRWEDSIGKGLRELGYEEWHAAMHEREIDEIIQTKKSIRGTVSFPHAVLGKRIYDYILAPIFNDQGNVEAIAGSTRDITDLKAAEEGIKKSEQRFQNLVRETSAAIIVLTGPEMKIEIVNDAYGKLIKRRPDELLGKPLFSIIPESEAYYGPLLEKVRSSGEPVYLQDSPYSVIVNGKTTDGFLHVVYQPYRDAAGNTLGVMAIMQDVTESVKSRRALEQSEERFRLLANEMPQFVWTGDANGNLTYFNRAVYAYSGLSAEEVASGGCIKIIHPEEQDKSMRLWQQAIATGEEFIFEHRFRRADGVYRWQLSRAVPQRDAAGGIQQWIGTSTDIQEQKSVEEGLEAIVQERTKELKKLNKQLQQSNEDLQQFAHVASHDLKEPVRKIKTFAGRLRDELGENINERSKLFLSKVNSATDRMFTMIDGVLTYSSINATAQPLQKVELNEVLKNIEADLEVVIQQSGAVIRYHGLPVLEGAPVLLHQLFYNLMNNSLKFAKAGVPPVISIQSQSVFNGGKEAAQIVFKDNGIGFEQDHSQKIFETFTRLNSKDKYEGTGLGLALCKKIVERHGGHIEAQSSLGNGAAFFITLPLKQTRSSI